MQQVMCTITVCQIYTHQGYAKMPHADDGEWGTEKKPSQSEGRLLYETAGFHNTVY